MKRVCLILWMLVPVPMVLTGISASLSDAVKVVDIAREKDITWLSLALAGAAIGFNVFLVMRGDKRQDSATGALLKVAEAMSSVANEFKELRDDLRERLGSTNRR